MTKRVMVAACILMAAAGVLMLLVSEQKWIGACALAASLCFLGAALNYGAQEEQEKQGEEGNQSEQEK